MMDQSSEMTENSTDNDMAMATPRPYWWPEEVSSDQLPESLRSAIEGILQPAYETMVVAARPGLEQSTGMTIVQLMWLEILQQTELGRDLIGSGQEPADLQQHEGAIARLLRLAGSKLKASDFLLRLRMYRHKLMAGSGAAGPQPQPTPGGDIQSTM